MFYKRLNGKSQIKVFFSTSISLAIIALIPLIPFLLKRQLIFSHESYRYLYLVELFKDAFSNGFVYPRWLAELYGGFGYPTFVYYPPGFFYSSLPISFITESPLIRVYGTCYLLCIAGTVGIYKLSRLFCSRKAAFFPTVMFLLTPYLFCNFHVRGALAEMGMLLVVPWPVFFMMSLVQVESMSGKRIFLNVSGLAVSTAIAIMMHPLALVSLVPCLMFIGIGLLFAVSSQNRFRLSKYLCLGLVSGFILSSPYWLVFQLMAPYVQLDKGVQGGFQAVVHVLWPEQLFSPFWGYGGSTYLKGQDGMSFQLGLPHYILAVLGGWWSRKNIRMRIVFTLYLLLILAMPYWGFLLWKLPLLNKVQFPWRFLGVIACMQAILIAGTSRHIDKYFSTLTLPSILRKSMAFILVSGILAISVFWYLAIFKAPSVSEDINARNWQQIFENKLDTSFYNGGAFRDEFLPGTVDLDAFKKNYSQARGKNPIVEGKGLTFLADHTDYRISCELESEQPQTIRINQFYLPGWFVTIDKKPVPTETLERELTETGLMNVHIPVGSHVLEAGYRGPKGQTACLIAALATVAGFLLWGGRIWLTSGSKPETINASVDNNCFIVPANSISEKLLKGHIVLCISISIFLSLWAATVLVGRDGVLRPVLWRHFDTSQGTVKMAKVSQNHEQLFRRPFAMKESAQAIASSELSPKNRADYSCDGNFKTQWAMEKSSGQIEFLFPDTVFPRSIVIKPLMTHAPRGEDCILEGTVVINDNIEMKIGMLSKDQILLISIPEQLKARKVIFVIDHASGSAGVSEFYITSTWKQ